MKVIKTYVNEIFKDCVMNEELKLQKEELYNHLLDKVNDLIDSGLDEENAIDKVLNDMGDIQDVRKELNLGIEEQPNKLLTRLNLLSFYGVFASILGIEVYFLSVYFFYNKITGFLLMLLCITLSFSMVGLTLLKFNSLSIFGDKNITLIKSTRKFNLISIIVGILSIAIVLPLISIELNFFNYLKLSIVFLFFAYLIIIYSFNLIDQTYQKLIPIHYKPNRIKLIAKNYLIIPTFIYLLCVAPGSNQSLFNMFYFVSLMVFLIIKFIQFIKEKTWFSFNLVTFSLTILISISELFAYLRFKYKVESLSNLQIGFFLIFALIIIYLFMTIIYYIKTFKKITYENFINRIAYLFSNIIYTFAYFMIKTYESISYSTSAPDVINYNLNMVLAQRTILFYLIVEFIIKLVKNLLLNNNKEEKNINDYTAFKIFNKKCYVLLSSIAIVFILFIFKIPHYYLYKNNIQTNFKSEVIKNFTYEIYKADNKDHFILASYKLSDGRYCLGYQQYDTVLGPIKFSRSHVYECFDHEIKESNLKVNHSVHMDKNDYTKPTHNISLNVFGYHLQDIREIKITYIWGETKLIQVNDDPFFFYFEDIVVPESFDMNQFWQNNYYSVEKIKR